MSFNKNACKRLSIIAGLSRENNEITNIINKLVYKYVHGIIHSLLQIISYCDKKTITVADVKLLMSIKNVGDITSIVCVDDLSKLMHIKTKQTDLFHILDGKSKGYNIFTLKSPFNNLIKGICKEILNNESNIPHIGKNVNVLLQSLTENYIIMVMNRGTAGISRETLLLRDIELGSDLVLKINNL